MQVKIDASGKQGSIFDALEDIDADDCIKKSVELAKLNRPDPKNSAFVSWRHPKMIQRAHPYRPIE